MSDVAERNDPFAPSSARPASYATAWARFWAKMLDISLASLIAELLWFAFCFIASFAPVLAPFVYGIASLDQGPSAHTYPLEFLWRLATLVAAFVVDAAIQSRFAATLGLKTVGARLERTDHARLSFGECLTRNTHILIGGLWLGFLSALPAAQNYQKLQRGELTSWDKECDTRVFNYSGSLLRNWLAVVLLLLVSGLQIAWAATLA